jgi:hypothetical protein
MRRFVSLPSIEQHRSRAADQSLYNGLVQARLDNAHLKLRREKLCRVEARQVEHATLHLRRGKVKADVDARAAKRSAAIAQQVLEARSRISVQLGLMNLSLRKEQVMLLAPMQDMAEELEEACFESRDAARERAEKAASKVASICEAAAAQVRQELAARARLHDASIESDRVQAAGLGPRRARVQPKLTAEERAAHRQAAAERAEAATRLQAVVRGRNERRCNQLARTAREAAATATRARARARRVAAEVEMSRAADELEVAAKAASAASIATRAKVAKSSAAKSVPTTEVERAMKQLEEAEALVNAKAALVEKATIKVSQLADVEGRTHHLHSELSPFRLQYAFTWTSDFSHAQVNAAKEAEAAVARTEEMEELRLLEQSWRKEADERREALMAELERAKLRMAEQTRQRVQAEANAQPTRRRVQVEEAYSQPARSKKNVLQTKKDRYDAGAGGLGTKHVDGCAAGLADGRVDDPVDGARCTKGPGQERHTSSESRRRSIDVSEGSASENGLCAW